MERYLKLVQLFCQDHLIEYPSDFTPTFCIWPSAQILVLIFSIVVVLVWALVPGKFESFAVFQIHLGFWPAISTIYQYLILIRLQCDIANVETYSGELTHDYYLGESSQASFNFSEL